MQAGDNNINRVIYIPFTTMSDLKDTHYLDSIWFNYETTEYKRLEQTVYAAPYGPAHGFKPADRRASPRLQPHEAGPQFGVIYPGSEGSAGLYRHAYTRDWRASA